MSLRVAIAHDFLETYGGAERVTREMALAFPDARVTAVIARPSVAREMGIAERVRSVLPPRARLLDGYRVLTPLYPAIVDAVRLEEADVLLTSSYAFAHRFRTRNDAPQVCFCHSPLRFAWTMTGRYREAWAPAKPLAAGFDALAAAMRASDRRASHRVTRYLTQSEYVARQIERFYGREAEIAGVPIDCDLFHPSGRPPGDYFLLVGRLIEPYLRATIVLDAFRELPGERLVVAGDGPAAAELRAMAPPNVRFTGRVSDAELVELMQGCRAAFSPTRHDFGMIPLEVMACGRPVLAYGEGGARHTVVPGVSGAFFHEQTPRAVVHATSTFRDEDYEPARVRAHAERWDRPAFRRRIVAAVEATARSAGVGEAPG